MLEDERLLRLREIRYFHTIPPLTHSEQSNGKLQRQTIQFSVRRASATHPKDEMYSRLDVPTFEVRTMRPSKVGGCHCVTYFTSMIAGGSSAPPLELPDPEPPDAMAPITNSPIAGRTQFGVLPLVASGAVAAGGARTCCSSMIASARPPAETDDVASTKAKQIEADIFI